MRLLRGYFDEALLYEGKTKKSSGTILNFSFPLAKLVSIALHVPEGSGHCSKDPTVKKRGQGQFKQNKVFDFIVLCSVSSRVLGLSPVVDL